MGKYMHKFTLLAKICGIILGIMGISQKVIFGALHNAQFLEHNSLMPIVNSIFIYLELDPC